MENPSNALILEPYEENPIDWEKVVKDKRIIAVIHRGTEGSKLDSEYFERKKNC